MDTYTIFAKFPDTSIEEVDVVASSEEDAREKGIVELNEEYIPGWEIIDVVYRPAGFLFY